MKPKPVLPKPFSGKEFSDLLTIGVVEADLPRLVETVRAMLAVSLKLQDASKTNERLLAAAVQGNGGALKIDKLSMLSLPKQYALLIVDDDARASVTVFVKDMGPIIQI